MAISKERAEAVNYNAISKKISSIDELLTNQEFQKIINQLTVKSSSEIESFANSELTEEVLGKKGIKVPKGTRIAFKPAKEGQTASAKKKLVVSLVIPGVGTISFRSGLKDKPVKV
jgi:hypothetical protein